jgi:hypothetical protein
MITETDIRQIQDFTFAVRPFEDYASFEGFMAGVGKTVHKQKVEVIEGNRALLSSAAAMPFHTDHPTVDVIAWFCESQSDDGGESLLMDFEQIRARMPAEDVANLPTVKIGVPPLKPQEPRSSCAMHDGTRIYYARWLLEPPASQPAAAAHAAFESALGQVPPVRLRLAKNEALIINNRRFLHGRGPIVQRQSNRVLLRHWVRLS